MATLPLPEYFCAINFDDDAVILNYAQSLGVKVAWRNMEERKHGIIAYFMYSGWTAPWKHLIFVFGLIILIILVLH